MEITAGEVEAAVRDWATMYFDGDLERGFAFEEGSVGYGYRTAGLRDVRGEMRLYRVGIQQFVESFNSYEVTFERLETAATAGVGIAWGFYVENFERRDGSQERVRVRFSMTLSKDEGGWHMLLFHRDTQPFDENGRALPGPLVGGQG